MTTAPQHEYIVKSMVIDKALADEWLEQHDRVEREMGLGHRITQPSRLAPLKRQLQQGTMLYSGQTIERTERGYIVNGRHRLTAVSQTGIAARFLVVLNADPATIDVIDTHNKRTAGNVLEIHAIPNANRLAAVGKFIDFWERGVAFNGPPVPNSDVHRMVMRHRAALEKVLDVGAKAAHVAHIPPAVATFCAWLSNDDGAFIWQLADLDPDEARGATAAHILRNTYLRRAERSLRKDTRTLVALFIKARNVEVGAGILPARDFAFRSSTEAFPTAAWTSPPVPFGARAALDDE